MFRAARQSPSLLCLLALLVALAGGSFDLCACDASSHGLFCPEEGEPRGCGGEPELAAMPCCAGGGVAPAADGGPEVRAPRCDCPELDLQVSPGEQPRATGDDGSAAAAGLVPSPGPAAWLPAGDRPDPPAPRREDEGPPSVYSTSLARHLQLHVLRC